MQFQVAFLISCLSDVSISFSLFYHWHQGMCLVHQQEYREEDYTPFPADLAILAQHVVQVLGFCHFQAEAGIINYYHLDSTLAGHTDHSELDHDAPLISIRQGHSH